tara:strand:- start:88 stop:564 length:477 start_codon:yes stop_codon:yes gene_type:complete
LGKRGPQPRAGEECGGEACGRAKGTEAKESKWSALAKMVKQYFAAPASSTGVERVFSAAGKMHGDLQKSGKDSTLDRWSTHSLRRSIQIETLKKTSLSFEGRLEAWRVGFNSWGKGRGATAYLAVSLGRVACGGQRTSAVNWHVEPVNWHGGFPKLST